MPLNPQILAKLRSDQEYFRLMNMPRTKDNLPRILKLTIKLTERYQGDQGEHAVPVRKYLWERLSGNKNVTVSPTLRQGRGEADQETVTRGSGGERIIDQDTLRRVKKIIRNPDFRYFDLSKQKDQEAIKEMVKKSESSRFGQKKVLDYLSQHMKFPAFWQRKDVCKTLGLDYKKSMDSGGIGDMAFISTKKSLPPAFPASPVPLGPGVRLSKEQRKQQRQYAENVQNTQRVRQALEKRNIDVEGNRAGSAGRVENDPRLTRRDAGKMKGKKGRFDRVLDRFGTPAEEKQDVPVLLDRLSASWRARLLDANRRKLSDSEKARLRTELASASQDRASFRSRGRLDRIIDRWREGHKLTKTEQAKLRAAGVGMLARYRRVGPGNQGMLGGQGGEDIRQFLSTDGRFRNHSVVKKYLDNKPLNRKEHAMMKRILMRVPHSEISREKIMRHLAEISKNKPRKGPLAGVQMDAYGEHKHSYWQDIATSKKENEKQQKEEEAYQNRGGAHWERKIYQARTEDLMKEAVIPFGKYRGQTLHDLWYNMGLDKNFKQDKHGLPGIDHNKAVRYLSAVMESQHLEKEYPTFHKQLREFSSRQGIRRVFQDFLGELHYDHLSNPDMEITRGDRGLDPRRLRLYSASAGPNAGSFAPSDLYDPMASPFEKGVDVPTMGPDGNVVYTRKWESISRSTRADLRGYGRRRNRVNSDPDFHVSRERQEHRSVIGRAVGKSLEGYNAVRTFKRNLVMMLARNPSVTGMGRPLYANEVYPEQGNRNTETQNKAYRIRKMLEKHVDRLVGNKKLGIPAENKMLKGALSFAYAHQNRARKQADEYINMYMKFSDIDSSLSRLSDPSAAIGGDMAVVYGDLHAGTQSNDARSHRARFRKYMRERASVDAASLAYAHEVEGNPMAMEAMKRNAEDSKLDYFTRITRAAGDKEKLLQIQGEMHERWGEDALKLNDPPAYRYLKESMDSIIKDRINAGKGVSK